MSDRADKTPKGQDDLADLLSSMADGKHPQTDPPPADDGAPPVVADDGVAAAVDFGDAVGGDEGESTRVRSRRTAGVQTSKSFVPTQFHYVSVKLSIVMGIVLLVPALWALALLLGKVVGFEVWMSGDRAATAKAWVMMLCWPVALCLLIGAWWFNKQLKVYEARAQKKQAGQ